MAIDKKILAKIEAARLQYMEKQRPSRPGPEWFSANEYAASLPPITVNGRSAQLSRKGASKRLAPLIAAGMIERRMAGRTMFFRVAP